MSFGATRLARHVTSTPTAMPRRASLPSLLFLSAMARIAGTITAPACTGPPSKVSSKSSPCAAVPLTNAAPAASSVRACTTAAASCSDTDSVMALGGGGLYYGHQLVADDADCVMCMLAVAEGTMK